ncbi:MAG: glycosyltransferase family 39 protein [Candidatus Portnoybacteria bacterium]|nr:glycosyltransferase family 39 protein [Candidatus Portnoybacteria bacterium]
MDKTLAFIKKHKYKIILAIILLLGAYFRFRGLASQGGLFFGDETVHLGVARSWRNVFGFLKDFAAQGFNFENIRAEGLRYFDGSFVAGNWARPGYLLILTFAVVIFGAHDFVATHLNVLFSLASVYLVYRLGKEISGREDAGLLAALALSISGYSIFFSRVALAQTAISFFLLLGIFLYLYSRRQDNKKNIFYFKISMLALGFSFTTHYNTFIFIGLIFIFEFLYSWKNNFIKERLLKAPIYFLPFIVFFQIFTYIQKILFERWQFNTPSNSYFGEILRQMKDAPSFSSIYINSELPWRYLAFLKTYDSLIIVSLFLLFVPIFIYKKWWRNFKYLFLFVLTFAPFVFYSLVKIKTEYNFVILLPLVAVVVGLTIFGMIDFFGDKKIKLAIGAALILAIIWGGIGHSFIFSSFITPYAKAAQYLSQQGKIESICGTLPGVNNTLFYLDDYSIKHSFHTQECKEQGQYVLLDWDLAYFPYIRPEWEDFIKQHEPAATFSQPYSAYLCPRLGWDDNLQRCNENSALRIYKNY